MCGLWREYRRHVQIHSILQAALKISIISGEEETWLCEFP